MRRGPLIFAVLVLAAAGAGVWYYVGMPGLEPGASAPTAQSQAAAPGRGRGGSGPIAVTTVVAQEANFPVRRRSIGVIESPATVTVKSRIDSQIVEQHVTDGQIVRKGDLLFTLDDREIRATLARNEAIVERDKASAAKAAADLGRTQQLLERNATSRAQLDTATAEAKAAEATVASGEATLTNDRLQLSYTKIPAPIGGRLGTIRVTPGNLVSANDAAGAGLVTITQVRPIRVSFTLPERDLGLVRNAYWRKAPAPKAVVQVYQPGSSEPLAAGALDFLDSSVDTASGTIIARATFPNENFRLVPGQYVDITIELDTKPDVTTVPTVAVQTGQEGPFVFVVKEDNTVEVRPVTLVGAEGDRTALASGLKPGEHVVVEGQLRLGQGTRVAETVRPPEQPSGAAPQSNGAAAGTQAAPVSDAATARNEDRR